jgi:hypothetical protein
MSNENETTEQPNQLPSIIPNTSSIVSLEETVKNAEKYVAVMAKIRLLAIQLTNAMDWSDQGGKPYLEKSGCDKIASGFGMKYDSPTFEKEVILDDKGEYVQYTCSGEGRWNNVEGSEIGVCSSRDDFFGTKKANGEKAFKPMSEVDLTDIKKKAFTNWANRLIKKILGLSYTWEELKELSGGKIAQDKIKKVEFGQGSKGGNTDSPETKKNRDEIRTILLKLCDGEEAAAKAKLVELTTYTKDGTTYKGKDNVSLLSEKQVPYVLRDVKKLIEAANKALDAAAAGEGKKA